MKLRTPEEIDAEISRLYGMKRLPRPDNMDGSLWALVMAGIDSRIATLRWVQGYVA